MDARLDGYDGLRAVGRRCVAGGPVAAATLEKAVVWSRAGKGRSRVLRVEGLWAWLAQLESVGRRAR